MLQIPMSACRHRLRACCRTCDHIELVIPQEGHHTPGSGLPAGPGHPAGGCGPGEGWLPSHPGRARSLLSRVCLSGSCKHTSILSLINIVMKSSAPLPLVPECTWVLFEQTDMGQIFHEIRSCHFCKLNTLFGTCQQVMSTDSKRRSP